MINDKVDYLISLPREDRERAFRELEPGEQISCVLFAPWEKRHELILCAEDVRSLVESLPVEELFWTLKAAGPENVVLLLPYLSFEQLQFVLDLDLWDRDVLRPEKVVAWLLMMFEADPFLFEYWVKWIRGRDEALLPAIFRPFIRVQKRPDDMDLQEAQDVLYPFTLDNAYYIAFNQEKLSPLFMNCLNRLIAEPGVYRDVMETILEETSMETLEQAYRWRNARLSDWGVPDYFEALDIFAPPPGGVVRRWNRVSTIPVHSSEADTPHEGLQHRGHWEARTAVYQEKVQPFIPTLYEIHRTPSISAALSALSGSVVLEEVLWQWTAAANKLMVAERVDLDDPGELYRVLCDASCLLNLGIEMEALSCGEYEESIMATRVIEDLIRLATSKVIQLKRRLSSLVQKGLLPEDFWPLQDDWKEELEQLDHGSPKLPQQLRESPSLDTLNRLSRFVDTIEAWALLFDRLAPHWSQWKDSFEWSQLNLGDYAEFTWPKALLTALVSWRLAGKPGIVPVPASRLGEVKRFLEEWSRKGEGSGVASHLASLLDDNQARQVASYMDRFIEEAWQEIRGVPERELDGRFIPFILIKLD